LSFEPPEDRAMALARRHAIGRLGTFAPAIDFATATTTAQPT
jgi:hypothetical protein